MYEELAGVNAELRYITVELMKIAAERNVSFQDISREYIQNVYSLDSAIKLGKVTEDARLKKAVAKDGR